MRTLTKFDTETALLPYMMAEIVLGDRGLALMENDGAFKDYVNYRARKLYANNKKFAKDMRSAKARDMLYMFINHWLDGWLADGGKAPRGWENYAD